ncbi:hypothetical protein OTB74_00365 [Streptomyces sp. H34-S4]|nr:hypothetical protein [Streptomyces sp. H34-S4]MCY0932699.1 hypothetical protein [Streptomyces sp. H34-S4]
MTVIFPLHVGVLAGLPAVIGIDFTASPSRFSVSSWCVMSTSANWLRPMVAEVVYDFARYRPPPVSTPDSGASSVT